ncbi:MAG: DUF2357 domain-containing protein [Methanobacterium sp.]
MTEQRVEICYGDEIGILTLKPEIYNADSCPPISIEGIKFYNIPKADSKKQIPIIFNSNPTEESARIILQEETRYNIIFKSKSTINNLKFPTLQRYQKDFKFSKFSLDKGTYIGNLNTGSYVGKSFFDVEVNEIKSSKIPFEVRPRKINLDHYSAMISDLCETASGIVFDSSPVFERQKLKEIVRKTFYEDFIFFEYLFRPENLLTAYEHIRRDPHKILQRYQENVPLTLSPSVGPSELISMVSDSANLYKTWKIPSNWPENMKNYVPNEINQSYYKEVVDNPENRLVKYFLQLLDDLLDEMVLYVKENGIEGYSADKIHEFHYITHEYLLDGWLEDVGELNFFPSNSQVLQKKAGYRDILRFIMILESAFFISWDEVEELIKGYQRKLYDLYEYWCYIKLFNILSRMSLVEPDYNRIFDKSDVKEWSVSFKKGQRSLQHFKVHNNGEIFDLELLYNRSFRRNKSQNRSYSLTLRPDYTLRIKNGLNSYLIHFDAKYRSDVLLDDIDVNKRDEEEEKHIYKYADVYKMHTYKDAIIGSLGSYVLYPGSETRIFKEKSPNLLPSVGAFSLTPGDDNLKEEIKIRTFIKEALKHISMLKLGET